MANIEVLSQWHAPIRCIRAIVIFIDMHFRSCFNIICSITLAAKVIHVIKEIVATNTNKKMRTIYIASVFQELCQTSSLSIESVPIFAS